MFKGRHHAEVHHSIKHNSVYCLSCILETLYEIKMRLRYYFNLADRQSAKPYLLQINISWY